MAVYLNNAAWVAFVLIGSSFCIAELFNVKEKGGDRIKSSEWLRKYKQVTVTICPSQASPIKTMYFSATHDDYIIDFTKDTSISSNVKVHINQDKSDSILAFANELGVYRGRVRRPCCGHQAVMKLTSRGLDATVHTHNTVYFVEPESRWDIPTFPYHTNTPRSISSSTCEQFSCIFYEPKDVLNNMTSTAANVGVYPTYIPQRERRPIQDRVRRSLRYTECSLNIVADHTFYEQIGLFSIANTISEMMYLVSEANLIFRGNDFNGDGKADNIGFYVKAITIFTNSTGYNMANEVEAHSYLMSFSTYEFNNYCLATGFTSKTFDRGIIGVAWVGGVCRKQVQRDGNFINYNTCVVTTHNNERMMPILTTVLTLAHELGHNFGSKHDDTSDVTCSPGSQYGNYIMYPTSQDGGKPNNIFFSPCSINYMYPTIKHQGWCFEQLMAHVCGNGIREKDEECDCGTSHTCMAIDPCCTPSDASDGDPDLPCTLKKIKDHAECSPKTSPCCTDTCKIVTVETNQTCGNLQDCTVQTYCNGESAECPQEISKPDKSLCNGGRKTCADGRCVKSICALDNLLPCTCSKPHECYECCMSNSSDCSRAWSDTLSYLASPAGISCSSRQGFCDGNGRCIMGDQQGAIDRMNQVFTQVGTKSVKDLFLAYWYYVLSGIAILAFLITVFVTTCRGTNDVKTDAFVHAQFFRVAREAEIQKHYLEKRKKEVQSFYQAKMEKVEMKTKFAKMDLTKALARMITFFPTAPQEEVEHVIELSANEETAVKWMLIKRYPFRRTII